MPSCKGWFLFVISDFMLNILDKMPSKEYTKGEKIEKRNFGMFTFLLIFILLLGLIALKIYTDK